MYFGGYPPPGPLFDVKSRRWAPTAAQRRFCDDFLWIWASFWGAPGSTLGSIWVPSSRNGAFMSIFAVLFVGASKTGAKKLPKVTPKIVFLEAVDMAEV